MNCVNFPEPTQNYNEPPFLGSFQQLLSSNIGKLVKIDFLVGSTGIVSQSGTIVSVGLSYVILKQQSRDTYVAGDMYSIKFIAFLC